MRTQEEGQAMTTQTCKICRRDFPKPDWVPKTLELLKEPYICNECHDELEAQLETATGNAREMAPAETRTEWSCKEPWNKVRPG